MNNFKGIFNFNNKNKNYFFLYSVITVVLAVFLVVGVIWAWTEPSAAPPGGNVAAPLNTGSDSQYKTGQMGVNTTGIDPNYGLTIGSGGIKVTGDSYFEGALMGIKPGGSFCGNNQVLKYNSGTSVWECADDSAGSGSLWTQNGTSIYYNSGNVGIGTASPTRELSVDAGSDVWTVRFQNNNGYIDFGPTNSGGAHIYTDRPQFYFNKPLNLVTNPSKIIAYSSYPLVLNAGGSDRLTILSNGNVGIGTASPSYKLQVNGSIYANGGWLRVSGQRGLYFQSYGGGWYMRDSTYIRNYGSKRVYLDNYLYAPRMYDQNNTSYYVDPAGTSRFNIIYGTAFYYSSDKALKADIKPISSSLDKILQLQGVSFKWKDTGEPSIGLISQDVEKIFPEAVSTGDDGLKSIEYAKLVAPLIEAVKEQQNEIKDLKAEIEQLKSAINQNQK